ncbi:MAG: hypothetical protein IJ159_05400 [Prevotella sp.]|nr:hypothetical protein [Prevotella sp.]
MRAISLTKFEEGITIEDAAIARKDVIAVSDGAGGGGVFADLWSKYLVEHLPDMPIKSHKAFDKWIDEIWEPFYNDCEEKAKAEGGMFLNKFYDEGSFATLVGVWKDGQWVSYGDSVAFCYNRKTKELQHSFTRLADFNNPPYLINCKDPLDEKGFRSGKFKINKDCIVFAASDTLAHYILMMYEVENKTKYANELEEAINAQTKNSNFIKAAMRFRKIDFAKEVIQKLENCKYQNQLKSHIERLKRWGLIGHDDYSLVIM